MILATSETFRLLYCALAVVAFGAFASVVVLGVALVRLAWREAWREL